MTLISVFHQLAQLPSRFCQIPISPSRVGKTVEHSKSKSTKPSLSSLGTPCTVHVPSLAVFLPPSSFTRSRGAGASFRSPHSPPLALEHCLLVATIFPRGLLLCLIPPTLPRIIDLPVLSHDCVPLISQGCLTSSYAWFSGGLLPEHNRGTVPIVSFVLYIAGRPICRKVLKIMFREVPPADWLILQIPTAQAGPRNSHGKKHNKILRQIGRPAVICIKKKTSTRILRAKI